MTTKVFSNEQDGTPLFLHYEMSVIKYRKERLLTIHTNYSYLIKQNLKIINIAIGAALPY